MGRREYELLIFGLLLSLNVCSYVFTQNVFIFMLVSFGVCFMFRSSNIRLRLTSATKLRQPIVQYIPVIRPSQEPSKKTNHLKCSCSYILGPYEWSTQKRVDICANKQHNCLVNMVFFFKFLHFLLSIVMQELCAGPKHDTTLEHKIHIII